MSETHPRVSVVIPTIGRPELIAAVDSVLAQDVPVFEVIVAADTANELELPDSSIVRVVRVGPGAGGNVARQAGIESATGDLIALLDDDDVWHGEKNGRQLKAVNGLEVESPWVSSTGLFAIPADGSPAQVWPKRAAEPGESIPEYIFRRVRLRNGVGFVQASSLLFPRWIAIETPFDPTLKFHQDVSWLTDVSVAHPRLRFVQLDEPLVDYRLGATTVSSRITPAGSTGWAKARLRQVDARTRGDFFLTQPVILARRRGEPIELLRAVRDGFRHGRPGWPSIVHAAASLVLAIVTSIRTPR